jgi:hypothetical protein
MRMAAVIDRRMAARIEGDFVVFLIGMRINKPWKVHKWLPVFLAMPKMLKELEGNPDSGFLGATMGWGLIVQYWRSFEHLEAFAKDKDDPHLEVWRQYWRRVGRGDRTGIWHESYLVKAGQYEAIYGNMPPHGLGKAGRVVPLSEASSARSRLREPSVV